MLGYKLLKNLLLFFHGFSARCQKSMNHENDESAEHQSDSRCHYQAQYDNRIFTCKVSWTERFRYLLFLSAVKGKNVENCDRWVVRVLGKYGIIVSTSWVHREYIVSTSWVHREYIVSTSWVHRECIASTSWVHREYIVSTSFSKSFVFKMFFVHTKTKSRRFQIPPIWRAFLKSPVFLTD